MHVSIMQYAVRQAAKLTDLWESAPYLENVTPKTMEDFYDGVRLLHIYS